MNSSATIETHYVLDSHALIWYLAEPQKLGQPAREILTASERDECRLIMSVISVAEFFYWNSKSKYFNDFGEVYKTLKSQERFDFVPFLPDEVLDFASDASVTEMHDRIIAGLARRLGVPLITRDPIITASGRVKVEW